MQANDAASGFSALGNTSRLHIFRFLVRAGRDGAAIGTIQQHLSMPLSTLAHHLSMLVKAELILQTKIGRQVMCRANFEQMEELVGFLTANCCSGVDPAEEDADNALRDQEMTL